MSGKDIAHLKPSKVTGRIAKVHRLLEEEGLSYGAFQRVIDDPEWRRRLVQFWKSDGFRELTDSQRKAEEILGDNFLSPSEAEDCFGFNYSVEQREKLAEIPFSEELMKSDESFIIFPGYPISIYEMVQNKEIGELLVSRKQGFGDAERIKWIVEEKSDRHPREAEMLQVPVGLRWYAIKEFSPPGWANETYEEQREKLEENTPNINAGMARVCEMLYMIVLYYKTNFHRLLSAEAQWCRDIIGTSDAGAPIAYLIGFFRRKGLRVTSENGDRKFPELGISISVKQEIAKNNPG